MAQVPYAPVPKESLSGQGLPQVHASIPIEAFGSEVAQAIGTAGKVVADAGDKLYERAMWLQNLNNEAEARTAEANHIIRSGQLSAEFNSLEGDQAVKAYPTYVQKQKALRESIKSSLPNVASQKLFDSQSIGTLSRTVFNASSHLASQQKKFVIDSMDARVTAERERVAANPNDDVGFQRGVAETERLVGEQGRLRGQPPEAIENAKRAATSKIIASRIEQQAKEYPLSGPTLLDNQRSKLTEADAKRLETVVNNQRDAYGTAKIASDLVAAHTDDNGDLTVPMSELQAKARGLAEKFSPDDPGFVTKTVRALDSEFNQRKYARKQENYDNRDILNGGILSGVSSMEQLLADPKLSAAYYALPERDRLKVPAQIDNYIKARDRQFNERQMTTIMGLKNNDVEAFLNLEPTDEKLKLSQAQIRQVQAEQAKIKKATANDPRVGRAMGWMRTGFGAQMEAMGVYSRTQRNKEDYDHLTGAVQQAMDIWQEDHKKPPTQKEFNEQIAPNLLKTTKEPGVFGIYGYGMFGSDKTLFKHDTGSKEYRSFYERAKEETKARGGSEPSDEEIYKAFTRLQLLKLYPPKGASSEKPNERP